MLLAPALQLCTDCGAEIGLFDYFCASCGSPQQLTEPSGNAHSQVINPSAIWLSEIGLSNRTVAIFAQRGQYVLADVINFSNEELLQIRNFGQRSLEEFLSVIADLRTNSGQVSRECEERNDTCYDPNAPAFGVDFLRTLTAAGIDPNQVPVARLWLSSATSGLFRRANILTLGEACRLTTLALVRKLKPRTPDLLEELAIANKRFIDEIPSRSSDQALTAGGMTPDSSPLCAEAKAVEAFEALVLALESLEDRFVEVLKMRLGLEDAAPMTLKESGQYLSVTRERVRQIESKGIQALLRKRPSFLPAFTYVDEVRQTFGLNWRDSRLQEALLATVQDSIVPYLRYLPLLIELFTTPETRKVAIEDFEAAVVAVLAGSDPLPLAALEEQVLSLLDENELANFPTFSVAKRIAIIGPAVRRDDDRYELPQNRIEGLNDKKMRRLQAMRRVIERIGPSHYSRIAQELTYILPEDYGMSERDVHAWLGRYVGIFTWVGRGMFGLKSQDMGIRANQLESAVDIKERDGSLQRKRIGIGDEIAAFLEETGPHSIESVEAHILGRFTVQRGSVMAAVKQDRRRRFAISSEQIISLR